MFASFNGYAAARRAIVLAASALLSASVPGPSHANVDMVPIIKNFVRVGVDNAASDFVALRGSRLPDGPYSAINYKVTKFPLGNCKVSKTVHTDLTCGLPIFRMSKKTLLDLLTPVIEGALPAGFSQSTETLDLIGNDILWKRSSDHISVGAFCLYVDRTQTALDCVISVSHDTTL